MEWCHQEKSFSLCGLEVKTCIITEKASITNNPPATAKTNSCFNKIDVTANVAPKDCDPVSPIKTSAGLELNHKNPNRAPIAAVQKITISPEPLI